MARYPPLLGQRRQPATGTRHYRDLKISRLRVVTQFETGRLTGSRATAKERRSKTAAAPAPNKTHCQVAKVGLSK